MAFNRRRMGNRKKKSCYYCPDNKEPIDYKDTQTLLKYISDRGKILPRRVTGSCASHQRDVTRAVKKARVLGLIPFVKE